MISIRLPLAIAGIVPVIWLLLVLIVGILPLYKIRRQFKALHEHFNVLGLYVIPVGANKKTILICRLRQPLEGLALRKTVRETGLRLIREKEAPAVVNYLIINNSHNAQSLALLGLCEDSTFARFIPDLGALNVSPDKLDPLVGLVMRR